MTPAEELLEALAEGVGDALKEPWKKPKPLLKCPTDPDPEVVLGEDLAPVIQRALDEDRLDRKRRELNADSSYGCRLGLLSLMEIAHDINPRAVFRITKGETAMVGLDLADRILLAAGLHLEFQDIPVYRRSEVRPAVTMQREIMETVARCRGDFVPPKGGTYERRIWPEMYRRRLRELQAA